MSRQTVVLWVALSFLASRPCFASGPCGVLLYRVRTLQNVLADQDDPWVRQNKDTLQGELRAALREARRCRCLPVSSGSRTPLASSGGSERWRPLVQAAARRYRLDARWLEAVLLVESGGNPWAVSPKGAAGLMQLMPATARLLGVRNPFDPRQSVFGGARLLERLLGRFDGDWRLALAAYNAGPARVEGGRRWPLETRRFVHRVFKTRERLRL